MPLSLTDCQGCEVHCNSSSRTCGERNHEINQKLHKISQNIKRHEKERRTKDDSCITTSSPTQRVIRGIDDPLLNGSFSDSGPSRVKRHRRKSGYTSAESGGESSSDQNYGGYQIHGRRWVIKD